MKAYPEYKESGFDWLDRTPSHWVVGRLKFYAEVNPSKSKGIVSKDTDALVTFLPMERVHEDGTYDCSLKRPVIELWSGFTYFERDDVIVAKITPCFENGKGAFLDELESDVGFGSTEFHVLRRFPGRTIPKFLYFLTQSHLFKTTGEAFMYGAAGQKRVPTSHLTDFPLALPPLHEQRAIANFLDRKTAQIDSLIARKQRQIELLQEHRTALINQAVTKGLNPDAPTKDSGMEWLGSVPAHWDYQKLKYLAAVQFSNVDKHSHEDETPVLLCNYVDVYYNDLITDEIDFMKATANDREIERFTLREGDVLITKDSESWDDIAVPAYSTKDFDDVVCGYHLAHMRTDSRKIHGKFLFWALKSESVNDQYKVAASGVTRYGLGKYPLENSFLPLPPLEEQGEIASYLDGKSKQTDKSIQRISAQIELLKEHRTAIISAAVTGKIDVRAR